MENYFVLIVIMSTTMKNDMIKQIFYFASGLPVVYDGDPAQPVNNRLHTGKEYLSFEGLHWYDNHARMYDPLLMRFTTPDPLAAQFPSVSPYAYCNNNPINRIDPDGKAVKPTGAEELTVIQNTLPKEDRKYVQLDDKGFINQSLMNNHSSKSDNYNNLLKMVNDERFIINTTLTNKYTYMDNDGNLHKSQMGYGEADSYFADTDFKNASGITTGETGKLGVTLLPGKGESGVNSVSPNTIDIFINDRLSTVGKAETFSHEGYGHTIMYINTLDRTKSGHMIKGNRDINIELLNRIIKARKETIKNIGE